MTRPPVRVTRGRVPDRDLRQQRACAVLHRRPTGLVAAARAGDRAARADRGRRGTPSMCGPGSDRGEIAEKLTAGHSPLC